MWVLITFWRLNGIHGQDQEHVGNRICYRFLFYFCCLFIRLFGLFSSQSHKDKGRQERMNMRIFYHLVHSPNTQQLPGLSKMKARRQEIHLGLPLKALGHLPLQSLAISKNLGWKWSCWVAGTQTMIHMRFQHCSCWLNLLSHKASSHNSSAHISLSLFIDSCCLADFAKLHHTANHCIVHFHFMLLKVVSIKLFINNIKYSQLQDFLVFPYVNSFPNKNKFYI